MNSPKNRSDHRVINELNFVELYYTTEYIKLSNKNHSKWMNEWARINSCGKNRPKCKRDEERKGEKYEIKIPAAMNDFEKCPMGLNASVLEAHSTIHI